MILLSGSTLHHKVRHHEDGGGGHQKATARAFLTSHSVHAHAHLRPHTCTHASTRALHPHTHRRSHVHRSTHVGTVTCVRTRTCTHSHVRACTRVCLLTHAHTHAPSVQTVHVPAQKHPAHRHCAHDPRATQVHTHTHAYESGEIPQSSVVFLSLSENQETAERPPGTPRGPHPCLYHAG